MKPLTVKTATDLLYKHQFINTARHMIDGIIQDETRNYT